MRREIHLNTKSRTETSPLSGFRILFPLHKPAADATASLIGAALKKQVALSPPHMDRVAVTLASGAHRSRMPDIRGPVDLILTAVLPGDLPGKHDAVLPGNLNDVDC